MGIVGRGAKCNASGCEDDGIRSLNALKVQDAGIDLTTSGKKAVLCRKHYKEWKKETKKDRDLDRARHSRL